MLKLGTLNELALFLIKHDDLNLICSVLNKRPHRESDVPFGLITEVDRVYWPLPLVGVYLLPLWLV